VVLARRPARDERERAGATEAGAWGFVAATWALSRVLFLATGALGAHLFADAAHGGALPGPGGALGYWAHWDGAWYSAIARFGYGGTAWPNSAAFFPLYPTVLRPEALLGIPAAIAGVTVSLAASLLALYFVYELTRSYFDEHAARAATLALALFPTAFFLNAVYTEGLFLAAAVGAVWAARVRENFVLAGVLGCFAAATRNVGVFLVFPLVHEWLRKRDEARWSGLAIALVPAGLLAYTFWLWRWSDHPLLFATVARKTWGRALVDPTKTLEGGWTSAGSGAHWAAHPEQVFATASPNPAFDAMNTFNLAVLAVLVVALVGAAVRGPRSLMTYAIPAALLPVLTPPSVAPLAGIPRYCLAVFPAFVFLGTVLARRRVLLALWLSVSAALGVMFTLFFTTWRWVA
jgi:hypothetical protein